MSESIKKILGEEVIPPWHKQGLPHFLERNKNSETQIEKDIQSLSNEFPRLQIEYDKDNWHWILIKNFSFGSKQYEQNVPLVIFFPANYPNYAPDGFFSNLRLNNCFPEKRTFHTINDLTNAIRTLPSGTQLTYFYSIHCPGWDRSEGDNLCVYLKLIREIIETEIKA